MADEALIVVIDTREQLPLTFQVPTVRGTLRSGDYSVQGYEGRIAIERKNKPRPVRLARSWVRSV